jgi:SAM-dependent methyltransferase
MRRPGASGSCKSRSVSSIVWDAELAQAYDSTHADMFDPAVVGPAVDALVELAGSEPTLEFAVGTGWLALPLAARGVDVSGIELSPHMAAQLEAKAGADDIEVVIGDMTTTRVPGTFGLVFLAFNTIMNVTTQEGQISVFQNAAAHLRPRGRFVVEGGVSFGAGRRPQVFAMTDDHIGIETYDDPLLQLSSSHHWWTVGDRLIHRSQTFRYIYPSELDLMGRLAGFQLVDRWGGWNQEPLTTESSNHIAVFEKHV